MKLYIYIYFFKWHYRHVCPLPLIQNLCIYTLEIQKSLRILNTFGYQSPMNLKSSIFPHLNNYKSDFLSVIRTVLVLDTYVNSTYSSY